MSTLKLDKESEKRLKDFLSKKAAFDKRWKSFMSYRELKAEDPSEQAKVFQDNFHNVFTLLQDAVTDYNGLAQKNKRDQKFMDQIVQLLSSVVEYLDELIGKQWQTKALHAIICNLLYKENKVELRMRGFEIYLRFVAALRLREDDWAANKDILSVLGQCFNFQPFVPQGQTVSLAFFPLEAPMDQPVWQPGGGATSEDEAAWFLHTALEHISKQTGQDFALWLFLLKMNLFPVMYPRVCQQIGIMPQDQNTGFTSECPAKLQRVVLPHVLAWFKDPKKVTVIWGNAQNAQLVLELYSHALSQPSGADSDVSIMCVNAFYPFLFSSSPAPELQSRLSAFRLFFLKRIPVVFTKLADGPGADVHNKACLDVLRVVKIMMSNFSLFDKSVQDGLLACLLGIVTSLTNSNTLSKDVVREMVVVTLRLWILTQNEVEASWKALQNLMQVVFNASADAIDATYDVWMQVTLALQKLLYPSRAVKESKRQLGADGLKNAGQISKSPDWRPPRDAPEPDSDIYDLWGANDTKTATACWLNMRALFQKACTLTNPALHARAVEQVVNIADYLLQAEAAVPYEVLVTLPSGSRPLELIDVFGPLLCEVMETQDTALNAGKAAAAGCLCRLFCRLSDPIPLAILQYVYSVIATELEERPAQPPSFEIISNSGAIFALGLPGCTRLIPYFLYAIKAVLDRESSAVPEACFRNCITIVCSLLCYPNHFTDLQVAVEMREFSLPLKTRGLLTATDLHDLLSALLSALFVRSSKAEHQFMCLCGFTAFVLNEVRTVSQASAGSAFTLSKRLVTEYVTNIVQKCGVDNPDVAVGACHCITTLATDAAALSAYDPALLPLCLQGLANLIIGMLSSAESDKKFSQKVPIVIACFECLEEWVMAVPATVIEMPSVSRPLFTAIEMGLLGQLLDGGAGGGGGGGSSGSGGGAGGSGSSVHDRPGSMIGGHGGSGGSLTSGSGRFRNFNNLRHKPIHGSEEIAQVAEVLLRSMLNLHGQWPGAGGPELTGTTVRESSDPDKEDSDVIYFFANGSIVSLIPPGSSDRNVRVVVRDESDRFAWNARVLFEEDSSGLLGGSGGDKKLVQLPVGVGEDSPPSSALGTVRRTQRQTREPPSWKGDGDDVTGIDKVGELLEYLAEVYDDCQYNKDTIDVADEIKPLVEETARLMDRQQEAIKSVESSGSSSAATPLALPTSVAVTDPFHWARLLLSHFNMVDYDQREMFAMLECGTPLQRSINTLDTKRAREAFKVGLVYVKRGQDSQEQILRNDSRSQYYDAFVRSMTWEVNMATHKGYVGGLDTTKFLTGTTAPYYATARLELMFHDITCMPTDTKDDQQIHKKRHVGNDVVNVVFSEHMRDYDTSTISSQFNCAHVIVYPLTSGLYRIQVCRKEEQVYPLFGPLQHNMCVTAAILPLLVIQSCLNANRNFTAHKAGYLMPFPNRSKDVAQLLSRYKPDNSNYTRTINAAFNIK